MPEIVVTVCEGIIYSFAPHVIIGERNLAAHACHMEVTGTVKATALLSTTH